MKKIYLDNAAATPIDKRVLRAMVLAEKKYGNPSSFNYAGRLAREEIESARMVVARFLGARPEEITFTASGSEANNLALTGAPKTAGGNVVLATPIEHPSVLETLKRLNNVKLKYIPVDKYGVVDTKLFESMLTADCSLVSVMYANNEIGTIEPIRQISKIIKKFKIRNSPLFHVDACQAAGCLDMNVNHLGVDLLTFNGSKIYGPRGIGALYVRRGTKIDPLILGGSQEHGLRAGTENVPAIVGLAKAVSLINEQRTMKMAKLRDYAIEHLEEKLPGILMNGPRGDKRLANNINICIPGLESENLLLELDKCGIAAGSGSACTSHAVEPSHVLKAIGVPASHINGALRFSLGRDTTKIQIDYLIQSLVNITQDLKKRYARFK